MYVHSIAFFVTTEWRTTCALCTTAHRCCLNYCKSKQNLRVGTVLASPCTLCHITGPWSVDTILHICFNSHTLTLILFNRWYKFKMDISLIGNVSIKKLDFTEMMRNNLKLMVIYNVFNNKNHERHWKTVI